MDTKFTGLLFSKHSLLWMLMIFLELCSIILIFCTFFTTHWASNHSIRTSLLALTYESHDLSIESAATLLCSPKPDSQCELVQSLRTALYVYTSCSLLSIVLILFWAVSSFSFLQFKVHLCTGFFLGLASAGSYSLGFAFWLLKAEVVFFNCPASTSRLCSGRSLLLNVLSLSLLFFNLALFLMLSLFTKKHMSLFPPYHQFDTESQPVRVNTDLTAASSH
jgi:hypothetical protein